MFRIKKIKLIFGFCLLVVAAVFLASAIQANFFQINHIDVHVRSENKVQKKYLDYHMSKINTELAIFKNKDWSTLKFADLYRSLKSKNWIEEVQISRHWPSDLRISIEPKKIIFLYVDSKGKLLPVTDQGEILNEIGWENAPDLPIVREKIFAKDSSVRKKTAEFLQAIPEQGPLSLQTVSQVFYDEKEGFGLSLIQSQTRIKLGEEDLEKKSQRVNQVLVYLDNNHFDARVIDANLSKKVLVRLRKGP